MHYKLKIDFWQPTLRWGGVDTNKEKKYRRSSIVEKLEHLNSKSENFFGIGMKTNGEQIHRNFIPSFPYISSEFSDDVM